MIDEIKAGPDKILVRLEPLPEHVELLIDKSQFKKIRRHYDENKGGEEFECEQTPDGYYRINVGLGGPQGVVHGTVMDIGPHTDGWGKRVPAPVEVGRKILTMVSYWGDDSGIIVIHGKRFACVRSHTILCILPS